MNVLIDEEKDTYLKLFPIQLDNQTNISTWYKALHYHQMVILQQIIML